MPTYKIEQLVKKNIENQTLALIAGDRIDTSDLQDLLVRKPAVVSDFLRYFCNSGVGGQLVPEDVGPLITAILEIVRKFKAHIEPHKDLEETKPALELISAVENNLLTIVSLLPPHPAKVAPIAEVKPLPPSSAPAVAVQRATSVRKSHYAEIHDRLDRIVAFRDDHLEWKEGSSVLGGYFKGSRVLSRKAFSPKVIPVKLYFPLEERRLAEVEDENCYILAKDAKFPKSTMMLFYVDHADSDDNKKIYRINIRAIPGLEIAIVGYSRQQEASYIRTIVDILQKNLEKNQFTYFLRDPTGAIWQVTKYAMSEIWYATCRVIHYQGYAINLSGPWCSFAPIDEAKSSSFKDLGLKVHITCHSDYIHRALALILESQDEAFDYFKCFARSGIGQMLANKEQRAKTICVYLGSNLKQIRPVLGVVKQLADAKIPSNGFPAKSDTFLRDTNGLAMVRNDMALALFRVIDFETIEFVQLLDDKTDMVELITITDADPEDKEITYKILPMYVRLLEDDAMIEIRSIRFTSLKSGKASGFHFIEYEFQANQKGEVPNWIPNEEVIYLHIPRKGPLDSPGGYFAFTRDWSPIVLGIEQPIDAVTLYKQMERYNLLKPILQATEWPSVGEIVENYRRNALSLPSLPVSAGQYQGSSFGIVTSDLKGKPRSSPGPTRLPALPSPALPDAPLQPHATPQNLHLLPGSVPLPAQAAHLRLPAVPANSLQHPPSKSSPSNAPSSTDPKAPQAHGKR